MPFARAPKAAPVLQPNRGDLPGLGVATFQHLRHFVLQCWVLERAVAGQSCVLWISRNVLAPRRVRIFARGHDPITRRISTAPERRRSVIGGRRGAAAANAAGATAAAAAARGKSYAARECSGIFFVEDIERRQADIKDFLLTESDLVTHSGVPRQHIRRRPTSCCGCSARQRQRQPSGAQHWYRFAPVLLLRSLLRVQHGTVSHTVRPIDIF